MGEIAEQYIEDSIHGIDRDERKKYYIVWKGRVPGIYVKWTDCKAQVEKFHGARFKSFVCDYTEAERIFNQSTQKNELDSSNDYIRKSIAVDAACSSNPGPVQYRGVNVETGKVIFSQGPFQNGTNNVGEFLAIVHALALCYKHQCPAPIYSDSVTAMEWVRRKKANSKLKQTKSNKKLFELIVRAEKWLRTHKYKNRILKWDTKRFNEIPADYGNKK